VKTQAFAKIIRIASATALLAFAISGPAARAQLGQGEGIDGARVAVNRDFLIGTWSDAGDCSTSVAFAADGAYATADGAEGQWTLSGDTLTLSGEAGATRLTIVPIDRNTMEVIGEDGSHDRSTRCAGDLGDVHFDETRIA
jgi:hypothetical protein